jgi:hypothetical protein
MIIISPNLQNGSKNIIKVLGVLSRKMKIKKIFGLPVLIATLTKALNP